MGRKETLETMSQGPHLAISVADGRRVIGIRALAGYERVACAETSDDRMNLVHDRAVHLYAEESVPSARRRIVAAGHVAAHTSPARLRR